LTRTISSTGCARFLLRLENGVEQRQIRQFRIGRFGAPLAGRHATSDLGAVGARLFGVERPLAARQALADRNGGLVDENGHVVSLTPKMSNGSPRDAWALKLRP
jgi:hypothetical protein